MEKVKKSSNSELFFFRIDVLNRTGSSNSQTSVHDEDDDRKLKQSILRPQDDVSR
jgi:hypothetical protein